MTDVVNDVLARLIPVIAKSLGVRGDTIALTTHLVHDLGLRAVDLTELTEMMLEVQNEFGVKFSDKEIGGLVIVKDIVQLLLGKLMTGAEDVGLTSSDDGLVLDSDKIFGRVRAIIVTQLVVKKSAVTFKAKLVEDLGADSLGVVELVMLIDEEFDVKVSDEELETFVTVEDIVKFLSGNTERSEEVNASSE